MKKWLKIFTGSGMYLKLLPFFFLYLFICIAFSKNGFHGDEGHYLRLADNLLHGFFSPPFPDVDLLKGPGYPLLLSPFLLLNLPLIVLRSLNGLLLYFSLIFTYKTARMYAPPKGSLLFTVMLGLYFPIFEMLPFILTESLTWFLISLVCYLFTRNYRKEGLSWKHIIPAAFAIAYLAMVKPIFGYVILGMLCISALFLLFPKFRMPAKKSLLIFLFSFLFCIPFLLYTQSLTHRFFFWNMSGGWNLYTMSTPYPGELGEWKNLEELKANPNHQAFADSVSALNSLDRDRAFKTAAIRNIKAHPVKYFQNWLCNIGRMLFSYPYSHSEQSLNTLWTIIPNMFILVFMILSIGIAVFKWRDLPPELIFLFAFILIYLTGSSLVSAYRRIFYISMPFWFLMFAYVFNNLLSIQFRKK